MASQTRLRHRTRSRLGDKSLDCECAAVAEVPPANTAGIYRSIVAVAPCVTDPIAEKRDRRIGQPTADLSVTFRYRRFAGVIGDCSTSGLPITRMEIRQYAVLSCAHLCLPVLQFRQPVYSDSNLRLLGSLVVFGDEEPLAVGRHSQRCR
jgi:hypothetical protein